MVNVDLKDQILFINNWFSTHLNTLANLKVRNICIDWLFGTIDFVSYKSKIYKTLT